jgi:hypothetical protein
MNLVASIYPGCRTLSLQRVRFLTLTLPSSLPSPRVPHLYPEAYCRRAQLSEGAVFDFDSTVFACITRF